MKLLVKNGIIVNYNCKEQKDILIENSKILKVEKGLVEEDSKVIDAQGKFIFPGFIDMHTHLRTPGREDEETLYTGSLAASKGGFTTILCMPNTNPCIDNYEIALRIRKEAEKIGLVDVFPVGAITKNREGKQLSEFGFLKEARCLALSDDGSPVKEASLLRKALEYAENFGLLIISHCEDLSLSGKGILRESALSDSWGLPSIPEISETVAIAREIEIARYLDARIHFAHISCARSVSLIERAKKDGLKITCETCPHYFTFSLEDIGKNFNPNFKVNPPLGTKQDLLSLRRGLKEAVIDCIATDHAPHTYLEKEVTFQEASFGVIGLEFAFSLSLNLVNEQVLTLEDLASKVSYNPARILGLSDRGQIKEGLRADLAIVDLEREWKVEKDNILSKSKNTPLLGKALKGKTIYTIYKGKVVYEDTNYHRELQVKI